MAWALTLGLHLQVVSHGPFNLGLVSRCPPRARFRRPVSSRAVLEKASRRLPVPKVAHPHLLQCLPCQRATASVVSPLEFSVGISGAPSIAANACPASARWSSVAARNAASRYASLTQTTIFVLGPGGEGMGCVAEVVLILDAFGQAHSALLACAAQMGAAGCCICFKCHQHLHPTCTCTTCQHHKNPLPTAKKGFLQKICGV